MRRQTTNSPAYGSIFLGLVKERQARVRPTLLEQTDIKSLRFDFRRGKEELTLARRPLLGLDAVPLVDLRELGSPLAQVPWLSPLGSLVITPRRPARARLAPRAGRLPSYP